MSEITLKGPEALKLCSHATINSFAGFAPGKAKQMVPVSHDGFVIGDGILFCLEPNELLFVGRTPTVNWLEFLAKTGGYRVETIRDDRSPSHAYGKAVTRRHYRYQVQGPNAMAVLKALHGGELPEIRFFQHGYVNVKGRKVRALRHGMAGEPGLELWGPTRSAKRSATPSSRPEGPRARGRRARAYSSNTLESGWIPSPLPAVYTGRRCARTANGCPPTAMRRRLDRWQFRLGAHRGLLLDAVRARLRPLHPLRPRVHRARGAGEDGGGSAPKRKRRLRGTARTSVG
jgi:vanillate/3-O-methylgallate O-demethylase